MANKKTPAPPKIHICHICGEEISGDFEYVRTRRGDDLYFHRKCVPGRRINHG